jgi:uncharacterized protein DUF6812
MATPDRISSINGRSQRVLLETERYRIVGTLVLPRDGYRSRLSDFLNASDRDFISLTEVSLQLLDSDGRPGDPVPREFATISRRHIVLATTDEPDED